MLSPKIALAIVWSLLVFSPVALLAEEKLANPKCPLMTKEGAESEHKLTYAGKDIYLCCSACEKQWDKEPDYYAALAKELKLLPQLEHDQVPGDIKLLEQHYCPFTTSRLVGPASPSVEYKGVTIYFSKPGHLKTWNADPDRYAQEAFAKGLLPQLKGKL